MRIFRNKKAILLHPATWIIAAFILGMLLMYLIAKGTIPINLGICPKS